MEKIQLLYNEYTRLQSVMNSYANSSFSDFQLLGAIAFLLAWEPISKRFESATHHNTKNDQLLFLGFCAIAFVFFIIATRDLMKQSIILFYLNEIQQLEIVIRSKLAAPESSIFVIGDDWEEWWKSKHLPVSYHFQGLTLFFVMAFPAVILWSRKRSFSLTYVLLVEVLSIVYISSVNYLL